MATTVKDSLYSTPASSVTQNIPRSVEDTVRQLYPEAAKFMAMVASGVSANGKFAEGPGLVKKKSVKNVRFEFYSALPMAVTLTVKTTLANGTTTANLDVVSTAEIIAPYCVFNTANGQTARVDSVTDADTVVVTPFGSDGFGATANDVLLILAPAYHEGSQDPTSIWKDEDNLYNTTQVCRIAAKISGTAAAQPTYFGEYFTYMKEKTFKDGKRAIDHTLLFGNRSASGNTTAGGTAYASAFHTTRGLWNWALTEFDCGGLLTKARFQNDLPTHFADNTTNSVSDQSPMVLMLGHQAAGVFQSWVNAVQFTDMGGGTIDRFGYKCKRFQTATFAVDLVIHDAFNRGALKGQGLLFNPEEVFYAYLEKRDLKPNLNIQAPSVDGKIDEIIGELGLGVRDGGNSVVKLKNICPANA